MNKTNNILKVGKDVLRIAAKNISRNERKLGPSFVKAINTINNRKGNIIVVGVGKSGIIANKFAATLSSTGNLCIFIHPTEAFHGDFGKISDGDVLIIFSHSGETKEIIDFLSIFKKRFVNNQIISITSKKNSTVSSMSNITLLTYVEEENPNSDFKLIPTTSTTTTLALSDAIALSLQTLNSSNVAKFYNNHPGGNIGQISKTYN